MTAWIKIDENKLPKYSPNSDNKLFLNFIKNNNIIAYRDNETLYGNSVEQFFMNGGISRGKKEIEITKIFPCMDHVLIFRNVNKDIIITSQPYRSIDKIENAYNDHKLMSTFKIKTFEKNESWYYPGKTVLFTITLKNVILK